MKAMILAFVATLFAATIATYPPVVPSAPVVQPAQQSVREATPLPAPSQATTASVEASWTIQPDLYEWLLGGMVTP